MRRHGDLRYPSERMVSLKQPIPAVTVCAVSREGGSEVRGGRQGEETKGEECVQLSGQDGPSAHNLGVVLCDYTGATIQNEVIWYHLKHLSDKKQSEKAIAIAGHRYF